MDRLQEATYRATEIMDALIEAGFDTSNVWSIEDIMCELSPTFHWNCGASRMVIWDELHPDYVVKLGIREDDDYYCDNEVEFYEAAVEAGVEAQFGWCDYIGEFNGKRVYAMEFLTCDHDQNEEDFYQWGMKKYCDELGMDSNSQEARLKYSEYYWSHDMDEIGLEWFEGHLSPDVVGRVDSFIYENEIKDIHTGNIGFRGTEIVLCDYAGWDG